MPSAPMKSEQLSEAHKARIEAQKKEIFDNYQTVAEHGGESKIDADMEDDIEMKEKSKKVDKLVKKSSSKKHEKEEAAHKVKKEL